VLDVDAAVARAVDLGRQLASARRRLLIGLTGPPGCGKSTLGAALVRALDGAAVLVPMDGFHLTQRELNRLGLHDRKGAPATFDADGYIALLRRLRDNTDPVVHAPEFDRGLEEPVADAIAVPATVPIVVTEGNYLLLDQPPWPAVRGLLTEIWYCDVDENLRQSRLLARHQEFGRSERDARAWISRVDDPNAALIARSRPAADYAVTIP
jgi:pantothenate kinase